MTDQIIHDNGREAKIQTPPYACPACGAIIPPARVLHYSTYLSPRAIWKPLDDYARHLHYLHCAACNVCTPVVQLGTAVLPYTPDHTDAHTEVQVVLEALSLLSRHTPADQDHVTAIVYGLLAGQTTAGDAIRSIHDLIDTAADAAIADVLDMVPDVAVPPFGELKEVLRCKP